MLYPRHRRLECRHPARKSYLSGPIDLGEEVGGQAEFARKRTPILRAGPIFVALPSNDRLPARLVAQAFRERIERKFFVLPRLPQPRAERAVAFATSRHVTHSRANSGDM